MPNNEAVILQSTSGNEHTKNIADLGRQGYFSISKIFYICFKNGKFFKNHSNITKKQSM